MLKLTTYGLELRGIANKTSKNGNLYYILYCENEQGKPYNFYVPSADSLPEGLKKGDIIMITFDLTYYKNQERLTVSSVRKGSKPL